MPVPHRAALATALAASLLTACATPPAAPAPQTAPAAALGARAAAPAIPDLSHVSVLTVTYREDKVVRIARQSLAGIAAG